MKAQIIFIGGEQVILDGVRAVSKRPTWFLSNSDELHIEFEHHGVGTIYDCKDILSANIYCIDK